MYIWANRSAKLPDEEADVIAVEEDAGLAFVVEEGAEVDSADHMPAPLELFFKALFDVLGCVLEVGDLVFDHLDIDVLGYQQGVLLHIHLHVAELDIRRNLDVGRHPILGNTRPRLLLFFLCFPLLALSLLARHSIILKMQHLLQSAANQSYNHFPAFNFHNERINLIHGI